MTCFPLPLPRLPPPRCCVGAPRLQSRVPSIPVTARNATVQGEAIAAANRPGTSTRAARGASRRWPTPRGWACAAGRSANAARDAQGELLMCKPFSSPLHGIRHFTYFATRRKPSLHPVVSVARASTQCGMIRIRWYDVGARAQLLHAPFP